MASSTVMATASHAMNLLISRMCKPSRTRYSHTAMLLVPTTAPCTTPTPRICIRNRFNAVLDAIGRNPIPVSLADPPVLITRKTLAEYLFSAAYRPIRGFPVMADAFRAIETNNSTTLADLASHCPAHLPHRMRV